MSKKVIIISQDYDGCFAIMTPEGVDEQLNGVNKAAWDALKKQGVDVVKKINNIRQKYNDYLTAITKGSAEIKVYVGSDRQSYALDRLNLTNNKNGSVFPALEELCQQRNTIEQSWQFQPLLLADPKVYGNSLFQRKRGEAYKRIKSNSEVHLEVTDEPLYFQRPDGTEANSKRPLLLNQMWDAYRQNPDATELEFHFIDDRQDLIDDILEHLHSKNMPPNMTLVLSKFDFIGEAMDEPHSLIRCGTVVSTSRKAHPEEKPETKNSVPRDDEQAYPSFASRFTTASLAFRSSLPVQEAPLFANGLTNFIWNKLAPQTEINADREERFEFKGF